MGQFTWKYVGIVNQPKTVTLYHGDDTGHVLITLDSKILTIDFNVRETKNYTFFIEDELCEIKITREKERFVYTFKIDKKVRTPLNQARKKREKKHLWQTAAFFAVFLFLIIAGVTWQSARREKGQEIMHFNAISTAVFSLDNGEKSYTYEADGLVYEYDYEKVAPPAHGFPLRTGDEFLIKYRRSDPAAHNPASMRPTEEQILKYFDRAGAKQQEFNPDQSAERAACLVKIGYDLAGLNALADFYFQNKTEDENPRHNENSYKRLTRRVDFQQRAKVCLAY